MLERLIKARFILQGKSGPRGRTDHKITAEGRRHLRNAWKDLIDAGPSGDLDADLRVALLAHLVGDDRGSAANFLRRSGTQKVESTGKATEPGKPATLPPLALWYKKLRSAATDALLTAESAAALAMAKSLPRNSSAKQRRGKGAQGS